MKKLLIGAAAAASLGVGISTAPVGAQPTTQKGLVNVNVSEVGVDIPISLAANICDVSVAALVRDLRDDAADCRADAGNESNITFADGSGPTTQRGLINVNLSDVAVAVPIGVAANVCDVNVAVLVDTVLDEAAGCRSGAVNVASIG